MRLAETVTFGGGGLDRAAHLRGDAAVLDRLWADPSARVLPLWRGKPALEGAALGWVATDHPLCAGGREGAMFLGLAGGAARFALSVPDWQAGALPDTLNSFADPSQQRHPDQPEGHAFAKLRGAMCALSALEAEQAATARAILGWHDSHRFCARCGGQNALDKAGWQARCAACGASHFPRTDPVVIMLITRGNSVLMGRSHGWPEGMYSLLAGFVEPGETVEAAVRREVAEEAGIRVGPVRYLASQPWPFPASLMLGCHGEALSEEITLDPEEIDDAQWFNREEILAIFAGERGDILPARNGAIARFLLANWLADRLN